MIQAANEFLYVTAVGAGVALDILLVGAALGLCAVAGLALYGKLRS